MVAKISFPKRLLAALNYNENKCSKGHAACIAAVNYLLDANEMNFHQKASILELRNELNERATTKTIHVSLNFDPSENLSKEKLCTIAETYMKGIGFEEQPYLVYQHHDAGHPHVHIVSTTIREDGSRINTHNLGRNQSEKTRKEIEERFELVKAEKQRKLSPGSLHRTHAEIKAVDPGKIIYGKSELKRSVSHVVSFVFNYYRFASLPEYNAALSQFNVVADRGKEEGRIYKNKGLVYRVLDGKGKKVGVPIKASLIGCQPTLENLERKFTQKSTGSSLTAPMQKLVKSIDEGMKTVSNLDDLVNALKHKNIDTLIRQSADGRIYGITFVDNENRVVFNGSDLGKGYSASSLLKRFEEREVTNYTKNHKEHDDGRRVAKNVTNREERDVHCEQREANQQGGTLGVPLASVATNVVGEKHQQRQESLIEQVTSAEANFQNVPFQLRRKKKKKKKKLNT